MNKYVKLVEETNLAEGNNDFQKSFDGFLKGARIIFDDYMTKHYPNNPKEEIVFKKGKKYIKLIRQAVDGSSGSVHAFVSIDTGDIFKPASFKAPAKGARGNIYDKQMGLGRMTPYGPEYNKR
jgi:hypothetical protein